MYTITPNSFLEMSQKAILILKELPNRRFSFRGNLPVFIDEGVAYPVCAVSIPEEDNRDQLSIEFEKDENFPCESLTIQRIPYAQNIKEAIRCACTRDNVNDELESMLSILNTLLAQWVSSRPDSIETISRKLAELLHEKGRRGRIAFDWKSYDDEDDIPTFNPYGTDIREKVDSVTINREGTNINICTVVDHFDGPYQHAYFLDLVYSPEKAEHYWANDALAFNESLFKKNIPALLRNIYYETEDSWKIGDFEVDFLGMKPTAHESSTIIE